MKIKKPRNTYLNKHFKAQVITLCFMFSSMFFVNGAFADKDIKKGKKLFKEQCSECHQEDGNSLDENTPSVAGFSAILTYDILDQFKNGDRETDSIQLKNGKSTDMHIISKPLSGNDREVIALYLATQRFTAAKQDYDKALAEKGKFIHQDLCENCHVDGGSNPIEDTPIQRGQWKPYLQKQFAAFKNSERDMPRRMKKRFRKLSDEDVDALIEFYISPSP